MAGSDSHIWRSGGPESLDDWLSKNQPSKISSSSPDTDGFLWVLGPSFDAGDATGNDALPGHCADSDAVAKAKEVFEHALEAAQSIKDDPKIPVRANKKDGKLSKKQFRDVVCGQTKRKLEAIAKDAQLKGGKWWVRRVLAESYSDFGKVALTYSLHFFRNIFYSGSCLPRKTTSTTSGLSWLAPSSMGLFPNSVLPNATQSRWQPMTRTGVAARILG